MRGFLSMRGPLRGCLSMRGPLRGILSKVKVVTVKQIWKMDVPFLEFFEAPDPDELLKSDHDKMRTLKIGEDGDIILEPNKKAACKMESRTKMLELSVRFENYSETSGYLSGDQLSDYRFYMHVILAKYCLKYPFAAVKAYDAMARAVTALTLAVTQP